MLQRPTRFLFPFRWLRVNPPFLDYNLPPDTIDPWAKREEWRYGPDYSRNVIIKNLAPGLGMSTVAFLVYVGLDQKNTDSHSETH